MPKINWNEFSEINHATQQERVIICSAILHLEKLFNGDEKIEDLVKRLRKLDKRLESFENYLMSIILKYEAENNGENVVTNS